MSEPDLMSLAVEGIESVLSLVSTAFAIISAYIAGLYFFLSRAPIGLRIAGFSLLTISLIFLGMMALGLYGLLNGADVAWRDLANTASGVTSLGGERPEWFLGLSVAEASLSIGFLAFGAVYAALAYMTFVYRWAEPGK